MTKGHVTAIIISPPDENEGNEEVDKQSKDLVPSWEQMIKRYKTEDSATGRSSTPSKARETLKS